MRPEISQRFIATETFESSEPFELESGVVLPGITLAYETRGTLNSSRSNAVLVFHALTGGATQTALWETLSGRQDDFVICVNFLGSCYGSTGPETIDPVSGQSYRATFPEVTIRDIARATKLVLDLLGIPGLRAAVGGSMGGMVALEMAVLYPHYVRSLLLFAVTGEHSAWRIAFSSTIRQTILTLGKSGTESGWETGMRLARQIGMISYRSAQEFDSRFGREVSKRGLFQVTEYLLHQGEKIVERFSPYSYLTLTRAMELYNVFEGRRTDVLASLHIPVLVVGIDTDVIYPLQEVEQFAAEFARGTFRVLRSPYGHDSFIVDTAALSTIVKEFIYHESICIE